MSDIVETLRYWALPPAGETREPENAALLKWAADEIERLRGLSDITRLDVMWQELVKERYAAENNAAVLAAEVQNLRSEIERLRKLLRNGLTSNIPEWKQRIRDALGDC